MYSSVMNDRSEGACWDVNAPGAESGFINKNACFIISLP
jgi:hypothetical protein